MTTNQTIDGVPGLRDLLDRAFSELPYASPDQREVKDELRALLDDKSAPCEKSQVEGKRERFQKWVMATKHPVYGFLDGRSLARGDDRTGYADEYVQGLWVAYLAFGAEQPAPLAVVIPQRKHVPDFTQHPMLNRECTGWNACLDELKRLNPSL